MKNTINLIFDFDGTLVDSFRTVISKFNLLAAEFHFRQVNEVEIESLRDLTSKELIQLLDIPLYKIPRVIRKAREHLHNEIPALKPFINLPSVLEELYQAKFSLGILTSNSAENVAEWLQCNNLQHLFDFIHIESGYFGKKRILQKIVKSYGFDKAKTFYIGDETRDIEAAKKCDIYSVAVTWGFNSEKVLTAHEPHFIARQPSDLLSICK